MTKNNNNINNSKYKVYNIFTIQEANDILRGEYNSSESLVDRSIHIPTLQEYIKEYVLTGHCSAPYNDMEEFDGDEEADVEFAPQDFRDSDIDEIKDYNDELNEKIKESVDSKKTKKKSSSSNQVISENSKEVESERAEKEEEQK